MAPLIGRGRVADYIPALARAEPSAFAMSLVAFDGTHHGRGRHDEPFSTQSISKVFMLALALALEATGDRLWSRVGREPSGSSFNSIVQLEHERGVPRNPFINAGAMAVTDAVVSSCTSGESALDRLTGFVTDAGARDPIIDEEVAESEAATGHRNAALAHFMKSFGLLDNEVDRVLDAYFHQCALALSTRDLARAALFLANDGVDPPSGRRLVGARRARRINALMLTCGHYDMSGDFAFRVGLPGKSGVGGGIVCTMPGVGALAVWSPPLNEAGNSLAGTAALEAFARISGASVFGAGSLPAAD